VPWSWIVGRTSAVLGRSRRLSKDDEGLAEPSASWIPGAMSRLMLRRLKSVPLCHFLYPFKVRGLPTAEDR
jgi:putative transposase